MSDNDSARARSRTLAFFALGASILFVGGAILGDRLGGFSTEVRGQEDDSKPQANDSSPDADSVPPRDVPEPPVLNREGVDISENLKAEIREVLSELMTSVDSGTFIMGATPEEKRSYSGSLGLLDAVRVTLTNDFEMSNDEVSTQLYNLVASEPIAQRHRWAACESLPCSAAGMSWNEAVQFTNRLNLMLGLEPCYDDTGQLLNVRNPYECKGYRLPTNAEWEYVARAGSNGPLPVVDDSGTNEWNFKNMLGGLSEWVFDYEVIGNVDGGRNPVTLVGESVDYFANRRVTRGAFGDNWKYPDDSPLKWHVGAKLGAPADEIDRIIGFRIVRTLHEE